VSQFTVQRLLLLAGFLPLLLLQIVHPYDRCCFAQLHQACCVLICSAIKVDVTVQTHYNIRELALVHELTRICGVEAAPLLCHSKYHHCMRWFMYCCYNTAAVMTLLLKRCIRILEHVTRSDTSYNDVISLRLRKHWYCAVVLQSVTAACCY
jgi:hypothetical protein